MSLLLSLLRAPLQCLSGVEDARRMLLKMAKCDEQMIFKTLAISERIPGLPQMLCGPLNLLTAATAATASALPLASIGGTAPTGPMIAPDKVALHLKAVRSSKKE